MVSALFPTPPAVERGGEGTEREREREGEREVGIYVGREGGREREGREREI